MPLECGIIFDGIPEGAISRKVGLIWGIPAQSLAKERMVPSQGERGVVATMEDLLDLHAEPYDSRRSVVCFDETTTKIVGRCAAISAAPAPNSVATELRLPQGGCPKPVPDL